MMRLLLLEQQPRWARFLWHRSLATTTTTTTTTSTTTTPRDVDYYLDVKGLSRDHRQLYSAFRECTSLRDVDAMWAKHGGLKLRKTDPRAFEMCGSLRCIMIARLASNRNEMKRAIGALQRVRIIREGAKRDEASSIAVSVAKNPIKNSSLYHLRLKSLNEVLLLLHRIAKNARVLNVYLQSRRWLQPNHLTYAIAFAAALIAAQHRITEKDVTAVLQYAFLEPRESIAIRSATEGQGARSGTSKHKATLCGHWERQGWCPHGEECHQAHGVDELREWAKRRSQLERAHQKQRHVHSMEALARETSLETRMSESQQRIERQLANTLNAIVGGKTMKQKEIRNHNDPKTVLAQIAQLMQADFLVHNLPEAEVNTTFLQVVISLLPREAKYLVTDVLELSTGGQAPPSAYTALLEHAAEKCDVVGALAILRKMKAQNVVRFRFQYVAASKAMLNAAIQAKVWEEQKQSKMSMAAARRADAVPLDQDQPAAAPPTTAASRGKGVHSSHFATIKREYERESFGERLDPLFARNLIEGLTLMRDPQAEETLLALLSQLCSRRYVFYEDKYGLAVDRLVTLESSRLAYAHMVAYWMHKLGVLRGERSSQAFLRVYASELERFADAHRKPEAKSLEVMSLDPAQVWTHAHESKGWDTFLESQAVPRAEFPIHMRRLIHFAERVALDVLTQAFLGDTHVYRTLQERVNTFGEQGHTHKSSSTSIASLNFDASSLVPAIPVFPIQEGIAPASSPATSWTAARRMDDLPQSMQYSTNEPRDTLIALAQMYMHAGNPDTLERLIVDVGRDAAVLRHKVDLEDLYGLLVETWGKLGNADAAAAVVGDMQSKKVPMSHKTVSALVGAFVENNLCSEAVGHLVALCTSLDITPERPTLRRLYECARRLRNREEEQRVLQLERRFTGPKVVSFVRDDDL